MRRLLTTVILVLSTTALTLGCGDHEREPALPEPDFTPVLVVSVDDGGLQAELGDREKEGVSLDPPRVPTGSVIEVRNTGGTEHRVVGDKGDVFDTGGLLPDEQTTVVLVEPGAITITAVERPEDELVLDVVATERDADD